MTDFAFFPPEINSGLIYGGAGPLPLFAAAQAWDGLAADLNGSASAFQSVVSTLATGPWAGLASAAMASSAAPYVAWLAQAAAQAEAASAQARVAATSFEAAQTATVHPAAVAANRTSLLSLIATNFLGQNTGAIAATEFDYVEMWAQDVAAMLGYHAGATSVAAQLSPFSLPPIGLDGLQSTATAALSGVVGGAGVASQLMQSGLTAATPYLPYLQYAMMPVSTGMQPIMMAVSSAMQAGKAGATGVGAGALGAAALPAEAAKFVGATSAIPKGLGGGAALGGLSAGMGNARLMSAMSVPSTWPGAAEAGMSSSMMGGMSRGMPSAAMAAEEMAGAAAGGTSPMPMPMPMGGAGGGGMPPGMMRGGAGHVTQNRPTVVPRMGV